MDNMFSLFGHGLSFLIMILFTIDIFDDTNPDVGKREHIDHLVEILQ